PDLAVGFYDVVVTFDHLEGQAWLISQGFPEYELLPRRKHAEERLASFQKLLREPACPSNRIESPRIPASALAQQFDVGLGDVTSNLSSPAYQRMVRQAVDYIHAGDVFQVNLAQRLLSPAKSDSISLYLKLRENNPAPYAGYFDLGDWQIVSSSPECFLQLRA